ncbi:hypothetical protein TRIUR3_08930 [Triticum urartu]|uniref:mTERF domain-containing protein 1, mitochondrial n=1 Tax=Triticum urartu TaxID=4572 RepID=M7ZXU8_TRIUA|nr:hypothetical protein TRIUR3_08930 [Triticum urartu]
MAYLSLKKRTASLAQVISHDKIFEIRYQVNKKLGVTRARLAAFVRAYPACLHASVAVDLAPIVKALRGLDVDRQDIPRVLERYPDVLGLKPDGTISTSVAYLVGIVGVAPRDIGPMVTHYPFFLSMRVGTTIKPFCDYITSLGLPMRILARIIEKRPYILGYDLEETVKPNVEALLSFGIRKEVLPLMIAQYPSILGLPLKVKLAAQQYFFNLKLKMDPDGFARAVEKLPQLVSLHQNVILKPVEFLRGRGITDDDIGRMLIRCPQILLLRNELMKNSFYFFKSELKRPISELLEYPEYFTYSLESRIKPRYMRVASKGIRCSLDWFLNCSDQRFEERMRGDFIEGDAPGPSFTMGGKLQMSGNQLVSDDDNEESDDESNEFIDKLLKMVISVSDLVEANPKGLPHAFGIASYKQACKYIVGCLRLESELVKCPSTLTLLMSALLPPAATGGRWGAGLSDVGL